MGQGFPVDDKRRQDLQIAVLSSVSIQHKVNQGPFQPSTGTKIKREARAGNPGSTIQIKYFKATANFPVRLRFKFKFRYRADGSNLRIFGLVLADGNRRMGDVRQPQQEIINRFLALGQFLVQVLDL